MHEPVNEMCYQVRFATAICLFTNRKKLPKNRKFEVYSRTQISETTSGLPLCRKLYFTAGLSCYNSTQILDEA